ncbi:Peroxidase [Trema orientale]|uniref:Peroxidase n=1 Tax=Trema orientale TaxID=63057 RepID=A0A2P5C342_TREOI|nr:Peroxidase [Trema orientale]
MNAVAQDRRMGASLLRLHFHDCFGCDASVLLDDDPKTNFTGEKSAFPNVNSLRGFEVIDEIKRKLESKCPGIVSCADILAVAARDSVDVLRRRTQFETLFPLRTTWNVELGRRDSTTASLSDANRDLPPPFFDLQTLIDFFSRIGFTAQEMVVLSGGHTVGKARCTTFRSRIYNESNIDQSFAKKLKNICPSSVPTGDNNLAPLDDSSSSDYSTFDFFDNSYFKNLVRQRGLLHSDQQLFNFSGAQTNSLVLLYSIDQYKFLNDFGEAMVKMGRLSPLTIPDGVIRLNCRRRN